MIRFANIRIRSKMIFLLVIFGAIPMILAALFSAKLASEALIASSFQELNAIQSLRTISIEAFFKERLISLDTLARTTKLKEFSSQINKNVGGISKESDSSFFETFVLNYGYDDFLILSPKDASILFSLKNKHNLREVTRGNRGNDPALIQAWSNALGSGEASFSDFDSNNSFDPQEKAYFSSPVRNAQGEIIAVVAVKVLPCLISQTVDSRVGMGKSGESYSYRRKPP